MRKIILASLAVAAIVTATPASASPQCNPMVPAVGVGIAGTVIGGIGLGFLTGALTHHVASDSCHRAEVAQKQPQKAWVNPDHVRKTKKLKQ